MTASGGRSVISCSATEPLPESQLFVVVVLMAGWFFGHMSISILLCGVYVSAQRKLLKLEMRGRDNGQKGHAMLHLYCCCKIQIAKRLTGT